MGTIAYGLVSKRDCVTGGEHFPDPGNVFLFILRCVSNVSPDFTVNTGWHHENIVPDILERTRMSGIFAFCERKPTKKRETKRSGRQKKKQGKIIRWIRKVREDE